MNTVLLEFPHRIELTYALSVYTEMSPLWGSVMISVASPTCRIRNKREQVPFLLKSSIVSKILFTYKSSQVWNLLQAVSVQCSQPQKVLRLNQYDRFVQQMLLSEHFRKCMSYLKSLKRAYNVYQGDEQKVFFIWFIIYFLWHLQE